MTGPDVWTGTKATILPGAIIAARAVATVDMPPYAVVGGNPAHVLGHRFDADTVVRLLAVALWDWPRDRLARNLDAICGADVARLEPAT